MPAPIVYGLIIGGIGVAGWAAKEGGEAAESVTKLVKWGVVAGGLYVSYRALQQAGALK